MTTLTLVNAIITVGNNIASATSGAGSGSNQGSDNLKKAIDALKGLLIPEDEQKKKSQVQRALDILAGEAAKGPMKIRPMTENKKSRGRVTRRRSDIDGSGSEQS